ncbi:MAG TPA: MarR family transcriptional regulator [Candidatus Angelobacter sp.]|nr:MarR family transcriptional regulator [Candidatus Angelobacter sp.]
MKQFENGILDATDLMERQSRQLVAHLDTLFFANLMKKHPTEELEGELPSRDMRAIVVMGNRGCSIMSDFASAIGVPLSTATHMVERLVKKGLVMRVRSEKDRRVVHVELSSEGRKRERQFLKNRLAMGREMLAPLSPGERELFLELLGKMVQATNTEERLEK